MKRQTIKVRAERALEYAKSKFKHWENKEWDENDGTSQCTNEDGIYFHAQCEILDELINTERSR